MSYFGIPIRNGASVGLGSIISLLSGSRSAPSLSLNFLSGSLDSQITFTRASTGTYFDSAGVLQTAAVNAPRFDYNPSTLAAQGLLIEAARTNLVLNSATLVTQSVTVTAVAHTLSFYGTGTVALSGAFTGSLVGSGAFPTRSTLTFTPAAGTLTLTVTGSATQAQLEAGAFATSYIPTTAAAATRAQDLASVNTLTPWYNATQGTLYASYSPLATGLICGAVALSDGTLLNRINIRAMTASSQTQSIGADANISQWALSFGSATAVFTKSALGYKLNDIGFTRNGASALTDAAATIPVVNRLVIGADGDSNFALNGHLQSVIYYPSRLSNAQLRALTV